MRSLHSKAPKTLPRVPEDEEVRKLLAACPDTFEGKRNRGLVALLADSGLRISEALRLRIEDVNYATRTLAVRGGKGQKDGVGFFGAETAQHLRSWLSKRRDAHPEDYLYLDRKGRSLTRSHAVHILHQLSVKAGLPRKVGPHALRHYVATSILRQTGTGVRLTWSSEDGSGVHCCAGNPGRKLRLFRTLGGGVSGENLVFFG